MLFSRYTTGFVSAQESGLLSVLLATVQATPRVPTPRIDEENSETFLVSNTKGWFFGERDSWREIDDIFLVGEDVKFRFRLSPVVHTPKFLRLQSWAKQRTYRAELYRGINRKSSTSSPVSSRTTDVYQTSSSSQPASDALHRYWVAAAVADPAEAAAGAIAVCCTCTPPQVLRSGYRNGIAVGPGVWNVSYHAVG